MIIRKSLFPVLLLVLAAACGDIRREKEEAKRQRMLAEHARLEALEAKAEAKREAAKAQAVQELLQAMLTSAEPSDHAKALKVEEILDKAKDKIDAAIPDQPITEAKLRETLGKAYLSLERHEEAEAQFRKALEIRRRILGTEHPETLDSMGHLADAHLARKMYSEAEALMLGLLEARQRIFGKNHSDTEGTLITLVELYEAWNLPDKAAEYRAILYGK